MLKKYSGKLYCFSPPVMLATFLLEFGLATYTIWRYRLNTISRLVLISLLCLGTFQLSEFMLCGGLGLGRTEWVQIGYVAITLLPALGLHLTAALADKTKSAAVLIYIAYTTALAYATYFILYGAQVIANQCAPNYAIFDLSGNGYLFYGAYYYGWLLAAIALAMHWAKRHPKKAPVLRWLVSGYAAFIVPTSLANMLDPTTIQAIPSIMCGFAVLFAIVLVWRILPLAKVPIKKH